MGVEWTAAQQAAIAANWKGEPPAECVGRCDLNSDLFMNCCGVCGWDDWGSGANANDFETSKRNH